LMSAAATFPPSAPREFLSSPSSYVFILFVWQL
jgi:hypothetical protein